MIPLFGRKGSSPPPLGEKARADAATSANASGMQDLPTLQAHQNEVLRVAIKDTLKQIGMPVQWVRGDLSLLSANARGAQVQVTLVVLEWNDLLVKFLPLLQQRILVAMNVLDGTREHRQHTVNWQFAPDCGHPYREFPALWQDSLPDLGVVGSARDPSRVSARSGQADAGRPKFDLPDQDFQHTDAIPSDFMASVPGSMLELGKTSPRDNPATSSSASKAFAPTIPGSLDGN
jgi:hypothetical protein